MAFLRRKSSVAATFRASAPDGAWQEARDGVLARGHPARGDAIRAACLAARHVQSHGGSAQVLLPLGDAVLPYREPQFNSAPDEPPPYRLSAGRFQ